MNQNRSVWMHKLLALTTAMLILGAGLVLAAQGNGRGADWSADPTDLERYPLWVPGTNVPMASYIGNEHELAPAPPR